MIKENLLADKLNHQPFKILTKGIHSKKIIYYPLMKWTHKQKNHNSFIYAYIFYYPYVVEVTRDSHGRGRRFNVENLKVFELVLGLNMRQP